MQIVILSSKPAISELLSNAHPATLALHQPYLSSLQCTVSHSQLFAYSQTTFTSLSYPATHLVNQATLKALRARHISSLANHLPYSTENKCIHVYSQVQKTKARGRETEEQRNEGHEQWNRATEKRTLHWDRG
jgi:hypothetical protein